MHNIIIIESVDSVSRDGPDTPIYIYNTLQKAKYLGLGIITCFITLKLDVWWNTFLSSPRSLINTVEYA